MKPFDGFAHQKFLCITLGKPQTFFKKGPCVRNTGGYVKNTKRRNIALKWTQESSHRALEEEVTNSRQDDCLPKTQVSTKLQNHFGADACPVLKGYGSLWLPSLIVIGPNKQSLNRQHNSFEEWQWTIVNTDTREIFFWPTNLRKHTNSPQSPISIFPMIF